MDGPLKNAIIFKKCGNPLGAKNNDSSFGKWVIVIFCVMEYRKPKVR